MNLIQELQTKLHTQIPMTKLMGMQIIQFDEYLLIKAPLEPNVNDKGTAFGGSLCSLLTITCWSMCWLISRELSIDYSSIVVVNNNTTFLKPVTSEFFIKCKKPTKTELEKILLSIEQKGKSRVVLEAVVVQNDIECVTYNGSYAII